MANDPLIDKLGTMEGVANTSWNWKGEYIANLSDNADGNERFSQLSATPDTTAMFAGPARFSSIAGASGATSLLPIGLTDGIGLNQSAQLQRLYEIGSNRAFFTRGKTANSVQFSKMLADQDNIIASLLKNAQVEGLSTNNVGSTSPGLDVDGEPDGSDANIMLNLDSEFTNIPFGLMLVFKTRGTYGSSKRGKILSAVYLEYCMFGNFSFQISSGVPVIMENIACEFDRVVPVAIK